MKKIILLLVAIFSFTTVFTSLASAVEVPLRVLVNNYEVNFPDAQPYVDSNGRTQVPVRFIGEKLGAEVTWDAGEQRATFRLGNTKLMLYIGRTEYVLNGTTLQMDTAAVLKGERTFVPARYVAEALGASVKWDESIRTVYIAIDKDAVPKPVTPPQGGTVKDYDGIKFNDVTDIDEYSRMSVEKSKGFLLKLADQLTLVKEDGNYVIKGTYPEIPEGYKWSLGIRITMTDGTSSNYAVGTPKQGYQIPSTGSFTKIASDVTSSSNVDLYYITASVGTTKQLSNNMHSETGTLQIVLSSDGTKRAKFVPEDDGVVPSEKYDNFDFNKMFQW